MLLQVQCRTQKARAACGSGCDGARHGAQLALALVQKGAARLTLELAVRRSARHLDTVRVGLGGRGRG